MNRKYDWSIPDDDEGDVLDALDKARQEREEERRINTARTAALEQALLNGTEESAGEAPLEEPSEGPEETSGEPSREELPKDAPRRPLKYSGPRARGDIVQIRDFPASIATYAQGRPGMGKALAAYVLAQADIDLSTAPDIPKEIRDLSRQLAAKRKNASVTDLYERLNDIGERLARLSDTVRELELATAYVIFDRAGFRQEDAPSPSDVDMLEEGVMDLVDTMRKYGKLSKNEDKTRHGRTIR